VSLASLARERVGCDNDETEQFSRLDPEGALGGIQSQLVLPQPLEQLPQVDEMFLLSSRLGNHVIHVDFNLFVHHIVEYATIAR